MRRVHLVTAVFLVALPALTWALTTAKQELEYALHSTPNPGQGAELFRDCAACHGSQGGGTREGEVPRIAGQRLSVLIKHLVDYRHHSQRDIWMEHFADQHHLGDTQAVADVAAYIQRLDPDGPPGVGDGRFTAQGAATYRRSCASCHGSSAEGSEERMVPRLAGQHYEYLMRQIYDAADGRRPGFWASHAPLLDQLPHADLVGLADYLSRLDPRVEAQK